MPVRLTDVPAKSDGVRLTDIPAKKKAVRLTNIPVGKDGVMRLTDIGSEGDKFSEMSNLGKVLDIIGRPGYAVKASLKQMQNEQKAFLESEGIDPLDSSPKNLMKIQQASLNRTKKPEVKERFQAAWRGLTGQERVTANELWGNVGVEGVPLLGFATEIGLDPLLWGGGKGYKLIAQGFKGTGKAAIKGASKIPGVAKAGTAIADKTAPVAASLKEMFVSKSGIGKLADKVDKHLLKREYLKGQEIKYGVKVRNVIQRISKKTGQSIDDIENQVVTLVEQPNVKLANVSQEAKVLANTLKHHFSNILTKEMKAGVPITSLSAGKKGLEYFPRITTKEAVQYLQEAKKGARGGNAKVFSTLIKNAKKRKTGDYTLQEFNELVAAKGLKSLGGRSVEQFFMKSPSVAVATRGARSVKAVTSAQFLDDVGKTFGAKKAPSFYQELPDIVTKLNPRLKGLKFEPEVMSEITRVTGQYLDPKQANAFVRAFDGVQNLWKKWTLAPFPKYHLRNMVGNAWNNHLAGVNPKEYARAQSLQMYRKYKNSPKMKGVALQNLKLSGFTPSQADDILKQAEMTATLGHGFYGGDIETTIAEQMSKGFKGLPLAKKVKKVITGQIVTEKGLAFGSTIENNARLAHFLDKLNKTGALKAGVGISDDAAMAASKSVKKFLFDYGDLTSFEKNTVKRLLPFYTWTRKNIPLQAEQLLNQPQKFAPLQFPLRDRNPKDLLRLKYARPDLYERLPVELKRDVDTVTYVPLEGLIPAGDLIKMVRPQEILFELLSPYAKTPIEQMMNKSFYTEQEIKRYKDETRELMGVDVPVRVAHLITTILPQARLVNELNKLTRKHFRKEQLTAGEQAFHQGLSSVYKTNLRDLRDRARQKVTQSMSALKKAKFWAKRFERTAEGERIMENYKGLRELRKRLGED